MTTAMQTSADPRAWLATTVDDSQRWYHPLPKKLLEDLQAVVASQPDDKPITEITLTHRQRDAWAESAAPALRDLEEGRGFIIIDRVPLEKISQREAVALYWLYGQLLGEPFA